MTDLKPCPFDNTEPYLRFTRQVYKECTDGYDVEIRCPQCGANIHAVSVKSEESAYETAVRKWNRRVNE